MSVKFLNPISTGGQSIESSEVSPINAPTGGSPSMSSSVGSRAGICAIMFTQFEDIEGYVVSASDPPNVMTTQFKNIGYQFLPDVGLCGKLISVGLGDDYRMIGVPIHIDDARYPRRAFVFCFTVLVDNSSTGAIEIGKRAALEMANVFHSLEQKMQFLSDTGNRDLIVKFLKKFRRRLNEGLRSAGSQRDGIHVNVIGDYWINFSCRLSRYKPGRPKPQPWYFPICISQIPQDPEYTSFMDLLVLCDGDRTVSELSVELNVDIDELGEVLCRLEFESIVVILDQPVDEFTRVKLTEEFHIFFDDLNNRQEAVGFVLVQQQSQQPGTSVVMNTPPSIGTGLGDYLVRQYCRIYDQPLGEFASSLIPSISARHTVIYGICRKFLRLKKLFPVYLESDSTMIPVLRLCDGSLDWDQIGFKTCMTRTEMMDVFRAHDVMLIWK
jgi:hypothetical protein